MRKGGPPFTVARLLCAVRLPDALIHCERFGFGDRSTTALLPSHPRVASLLASSARAASPFRSPRSTTCRRRAEDGPCHRAFAPQPSFVPSPTLCRCWPGACSSHAPSMRRRRTIHSQEQRRDHGAGRASREAIRRRARDVERRRTGERSRHFCDPLDRARAIRGSTYRAPTEIVRRSSLRCRAAQQGARDCRSADENCRPGKWSHSAARRDRWGARSLPALRAAG